MNDSTSTSGRVDARPVRGHAVAGQVARHDVEQARHGGGAGEPEDADRRDVVDRAEALAEEVVREVGQGAAVGRRRPAGTLRRGMSRVVTSEEPMSRTLMMSAAVVSSLRALRMRPVRLLGRVGRVALDERHDDDAGLEAGQAQRQRGEDEQRRPDDPERAPSGPRSSPSIQSRNAVGWLPISRMPRTMHDRAEPEVGDDEDDGDADGLLEPLEEDAARAARAASG